MSTELGLQLIETEVRHRVRALVVREDALGLVLAGRKRIFTGGHELQIEAGQLFAIPRGSRIDVVNDPAGKPAYVARMLAFGAAAIEHFLSRYPEFSATPALPESRRLVPDAGLRRTFGHAVATMQDAEASARVRELCAFELLVRLAEAGWRFDPPQALAWADRVRRMVRSRPEVPWTLDALAAGLGMGASTLQRRLAEEGTGLRDCLRETRLEIALGLLQEGRLPVAEIAHRCGYAAHGRFSLAFKARYGFAPSMLRPARGGAHSGRGAVHSAPAS